jgi:regulator of sigma E protease
MMRDKDGVLDFTVKRDGTTLELRNVELARTDEDGTTRIVYDFIIRGLEPSVLSVAKYSVLHTVSIARMVWISLFDLVTGQVRVPRHFGPIGVVGYIAQAAETKPHEQCYSVIEILMAIISVNIGIFNLLPIPALDGGRLFFMFIEMIRRKPIPKKYESWIHATGLILLLTFMAAISFKDILYMFRG